MTKDEALKLALEALELEDMACRYEKEPTLEHIAKAITAIKEALAQPEQHQDWCASLTQMLASMPPKPAPCNCKPESVIDKSAAVRIATALGWEPKRKPLTDEEIDAKWRKATELPALTSEFVRSFARAIEAAHGIKE